jgi:uncharacterized integral membrane protein
MTFLYFVVALVAAAVAVFALQNGEPTAVRFLAWTAGFPLAGLILLALACGLVIAGVPLLIQRWRLRGRVRALERRVAELESARATGAAPGREPPRDPRSHGSPGG